MSLFITIYLYTYKCRSQTISPWLVGIKSGIANGGVSYAGSLEDASFVPFLAFTGGYHPKSTPIGIYLDIQGEQRTSTSFAFSSASTQPLYYITLPAYTRIGLPSSRVHGIIGGYYGQCLNNPPARTTTYQWALRRHEWGGVLGLDVKVLEQPKFNLLVGLTGRWGFTPMFQADNPRYFNAYGNSRLFALTITSYFHSN